jgi:uncharacterized protein YbcI
VTQGRYAGDEVSDEHTGAEVISVHSDIPTKSREWLDVFVLDRNTQEE